MITLYLSDTRYNIWSFMGALQIAALIYQTSFHLISEVKCTTNYH